ncbi:MAG: cell division protein FtsW [Bryobacterales bacterium]|nr:cell division protein FtsW [Bryobacterales bacterium]
MAQVARTDRSLFGVTIALVFFGLVMVYSASSVMAHVKFNSEYYFVARQAAWVVASIATLLFFKNLPYRRLRNPVVAFGGVGAVVVLLALAYWVDPRHRWIDFKFFHVQPAELAKPAVIVFLAFFMTHRARAINNRHTLMPAALAVGLVTVGVVLADLGTAVVLGLTAGAILYVAGMDRRYFVALIAGSILFVGAAIASKPYRLARVVQFVDPHYELIAKIDPSGGIREYLGRSVAARSSNYQADQSKIAIGDGGVTGVGLMQGRQKLFYLPEAHTDFIFAVIAEELGLPGTMGLLLAFGVILWRGMLAALRTEDDFGRYLALGLTVSIVVQALFNISVALALVPTKGITLPMISFGGSSLLSTLAMMGVLMNVSENS